jgi:anti-sigma factor RsiW
MQENRDHSWKKLKLFAGLVALAFAVTLALIVGNRLSDEALGVLAGAVCGVGAAIPTSLLVVAVSRRREEPQRRERQHPIPQQHSYPPVVVVTPQGGQQWPNNWNSLPPSLAAPMERNFTVVGGPSADMEATNYGTQRRS